MLRLLYLDRYELAMNLSSLVDVSVQYVMVAYAGTLHHTYGEGKSFEVIG